MLAFIDAIFDFIHKAISIGVTIVFVVAAICLFWTVARMWIRHSPDRIAPLEAEPFVSVVALFARVAASHKVGSFSWLVARDRMAEMLDIPVCMADSLLVARAPTTVDATQKTSDEFKDRLCVELADISYCSERKVCLQDEVHMAVSIIWREPLEESEKRLDDYYERAWQRRLEWEAECERKAMEEVRRDSEAPHRPRVGRWEGDLWSGAPTTETQHRQQPRQRQQQEHVAVRPSTHHEALAELGLSADASVGDIRSAYRRLIQEHHPDRASAKLKAAATAKTAKINAAYDLLTSQAAA